MTDIIVTDGRIEAMSIEAIDKVRALEAVTRELPQVDLETEHVLHGGMYARTIRLAAGICMTGVFIQVPTTLIFNGHATVNTGNGPMVLAGYHVLAASAHRRQAFVTHAPSTLTMIFATQATTIHEAEEEFTNEAHLLMSRAPDAINHIILTGE